LKNGKLIVLSLFAVLIGGYALLKYLPASPFSEAKLTHALPFDTPYFIQFAHFPDSTSSLKSEVPDIEKTMYWTQVLTYLEITQLDGREKILAWPVGWEDNDRQLFIYDIKGIELPLKRWMSEGVKNTQYKGYSIYQVKDFAGVNLVIAQFKNLLLMSQQSLLIEDALRELSAQNEEGGEDHSSPEIWSHRISQERPSSYFNLNYAQSFFQDRNPQGWSHFRSTGMEWLQLSWEKNIDSSSGLFQAQAADAALTKSRKTGLRMGEVLGIIPAWVNNWEALQLADMAQTYQGLSKGQTDWFSRYVLPWAGEHIAWADLIQLGNPSGLTWFVPCKDTLIAEQSLEALLAEAGELDRINYQSYELVQGNIDKLFAAWHQGVATTQNPWWTKIGSYYVFAAEKQSLQQLIDAYIVGQTLLQLELPSDYISLETQWLRILPAPAPWKLNGDAVWLRGKPDNGVWEITGYRHLRSQKGETPPSIVWRSPLRTTVDRAPQVVDVSGTSAEILVTDQGNRLYCLDQQGEIRWQKPLEGTRLSSFFTLPQPQTGRKVLVFNTTRALYQLDDSGEAIKPFPLPLSPAATNGVTALDFQQEGIYQFYVACEAGIFGFSAAGVPLAGWNPLVTSGRFEQAIQHLQDRTHDYLLAMNRAGVVYNWKRSAEMYFPAIQTQATANPLGVEESRRLQRVVSVDSTGLAQFINMKGEQFSLSLPVGDNENVKFAFGNFTGDERSDFALTSGRQLALHYYSTKGLQEQFQIDLAREPDQLFSVEVFGGKALIGTLYHDRQEIELYDEQGRLLPGFPLAGSTPFSLYPLVGEREYLLVVGQEEWVIAYRISIP